MIHIFKPDHPQHISPTYHCPIGEVAIGLPVDFDDENPLLPVWTKPQTFVGWLSHQATLISIVLVATNATAKKHVQKSAKQLLRSAESAYFLWLMSQLNNRFWDYVPKEASWSCWMASWPYSICMWCKKRDVVELKEPHIGWFLIVYVSRRSMFGFRMVHDASCDKPVCNAAMRGLPFVPEVGQCFVCQLSGT